LKPELAKTIRPVIFSFMRLLIYVILIFQVLFSGIDVFAQQKESVQKPTLGIHFVVNDYFFRGSFKTYYNSSITKLSPGLALSFTKGISKHFDWTVTGYGTFADSVLKNTRAYGERSFFADANFSIRAKMFSNTKAVQPFLQAGLGISRYKTITELGVPFGAGLQANIFRGGYLILQTKYNLPLGSAFTDYFSHSLGIATTIGKARRKPTKKSIEPAISLDTIRIDTAVQIDTDSDGVLDSADICPTVPGLKEFNGCPDRDKDGVEDRFDQAPDVPGLVEYQGRPIPDTDKDGILDNEDKCIEVPGVPAYNGCPVPDRDNDGIADEYDKCPDIKGNTNNGCPGISSETKEKIERAAKNIFFNTGSYTLSSKSIIALNEIIAILKYDQTLMLSLTGHTDDVGDSVVNEILSEKRAMAVLKYLSDRGISKDRFKASGVGKRRPVKSNSTASGRSSNRRVELKFEY